MQRDQIGLFELHHDIARSVEQRADSGVVFIARALSTKYFVESRHVAACAASPGFSSFSPVPSRLDAIEVLIVGIFARSRGRRR